MDALKSDEIILNTLAEKARNLESVLDGEVILLRISMDSGIDDVVRREVENLARAEGCRGRLIVVLETNGGSVEVVERISDVFRHYFETVTFIVPNQAYSAGTVLVLSGDAIYMDYYAVLGPIDPQIRNYNGRWVPGLGYLEKYNSLVEKSKTGDIAPVEVEFLLRRFDPAELFVLEQARAHSVDLVEQWLSQYKFKDWLTKETSGVPVTDEDRKRRARDIAELLVDPTEWKLHGRGIGLKTLQSDRLKLKIDNFGTDDVLNRAVREYYDLFVDYCGMINLDMAVHTKYSFVPYTP